jgi:nitrogenase molybdenum-iron protein NifN
LTETIGDNVEMLLHEYHSEFSRPGSARVVSVSTPSYSGTHMEGFHGAVRAVVEQLCEEDEPNDTINLLCGFVSAADIRYLKEMNEDFGLQATVLPDYSDTLDGVALDDYPLIPDGGTPLGSIRSMGGAMATIELGSTLPELSGGSVLQERHRVPLSRAGLPIGIRATDHYLELLSSLSGREIPPKYTAARGRLVDALVDGHKYVFGKRAVVFGEQDLVVGLAGLLAEIGVQVVLCGSGGKSGRFQEAITEVLSEFGTEPPEVREGVDFYDIEGLAVQRGADLLVGHSKGYSFARKHDIPLIRVGFPIHDRVGGQRILHLGYHGAQMLFDTIANTIIEKTQDDSTVGYSYM